MLYNKNGKNNIEREVIIVDKTINNMFAFLNIFYLLQFTDSIYLAARA